MGRSYILLLSTDIVLVIFLWFLFQLGLLIGGWLLFTVLLFSLGGWLSNELIEITSGASFVVFLVTASFLGIIWLPLSFIVFLAYLGSVIGGRYVRHGDRSIAARVIRGSATATLAGFLAIGIVSIGLTMPPNTNPILLWIPALPLGFLGWFFPEINRKIGARSAKGPTLRSAELYLGVIFLGLVEPVYLGVGYRLSSLLALMTLLTFLHLRAVSYARR
jgi:hypothetical protein